MTTEPFNIIVSPFDVWFAPTGTAFPEVNAAPAAGWTKFGQNGNDEYSEDGVVVTHEQTVDFHYFLGDSAPRKATRSREGLRVEFTVHDMSLEMYGIVMNQEVTDEVGPPAAASIPLYRGLDVSLYSFLIRGPSPYMAEGDLTGKMQYEIPVAAIDGEPEITYNKTEPAGLLVSLFCLVDPEAATNAEKFGRLVAQTA
jgi:hypothetical protein